MKISILPAAALVSLLIASMLVRADDDRLSGPLRVHPENRRYFTDGSGRAVYLTGSHTWSSLVDIGPGDPPPAFDFDAYLLWMRRYDHNFMRLWTWELTTWDTRGNSARHRKERPHTAAPQPWRRTGPGNARDGKPRFDLESFDPEYFQRLRSRVEAAAQHGIYVSVMLFEGWGMQFSPGGWESHPFHAENNVNGINGDADGDGRGLEVHTLAIPAITRLQETYVRKAIDTINDLDNVLYEISNENHPPSTPWQYHMIEFIHRDERSRPKQHPVGMTFQYRGGSNDSLFESPADWISPNREGGYRDDPPSADGRKVVLNDTDHLWGIGGNAPWVWKSFLRGHNPIFMDPYDGVVLGTRFDPEWEPIRLAMGHTVAYAGRMDLAAMTPRGDLSSTGYCLANAGAEYLVYLPSGGKATVDLSHASGALSLEWFDPSSGKVEAKGTAAGGGKRELTAPFSGHAVLYLSSAKTSAAVPPEDEYFPPPESEGGWRELADPAEIREVAGMDPGKLDELRDWLLESDRRDFAAVVIRRGHVVLEVERGNSSRTDARRVASVSKAICATVLAIASERSRTGQTPREMTFDDPAFDFIPWAKPLSDPRKAKITVKQLLNHTSGICPEATGARNDGTWQYVLGHSGDPKTERLAFDPGTASGYSTHALHHASLVCETVTGKPYDEFAIEALFRPLGVEHWWFQYFDGDERHGRHPSHGMGMPARDLARVAYCMLRGGRWRDEQVIPRWFVEETAAPTHEVKGEEMRFKINAETFSHGWELPARLTGEGPRSGHGIPADARYKPGSGGQLVAFVPGLDLVVTRQTGSSGQWEYQEYLRRACQAVLEED